MRSIIRSLFTAHDSLSGAAYLGWGLALAVIKFALDVALVEFGFGREWRPTDYFFPRAGRIRPGVDVPLATAAMLVALAAPFIWIGVNLTIRRLRTVGWPALLACLFFVPYVNFVFFAVLVFKGAASEDAGEVRRPTISGSVKIAVVVSMVCLALAAFATMALEAYGWGLFVGIPFFTGFIPALIDGREEAPTFGEGVKQMLIVQGFIAVCMLLFALEGVICLVMAAPISLVVGMIGVAFGLMARSLPLVASRRPEVGCASFLLSLAVILGETRLGVEPTLFEVTSRIEVNAPPERVWKSVVTFSELPEPTEMIFRAGLAYPIRAEIRGSGVGAVRHCVFSTGPFVEPITVWDEPNLLRFSVTSNPPPMKELSLAEIHPAHLEGFLESEQGQFELKRLPGGRTELIGTTWYRHGLWPETYWRVWSDYIIHTIHLRVLRHIKEEVEGGG